MEMLRSAALRFLVRREYSRLDLEKKLLRKGFERKAVSAVIQQLIDEKLLSDERFCEAFIQNRMRQGYGPRRIVAELQQYGVDEQVVHAMLPQTDSVWLAIINKLLAKKKINLLSKDSKEQWKKIQYLCYRGFEQEQIKKLFKTMQ